MSHSTCLFLSIYIYILHRYYIHMYKYIITRTIYLSTKLVCCLSVSRTSTYNSFCYCCGVVAFVLMPHYFLN